MSEEWSERARSFDAHAAQYDAVRPDYPSALVDAVLEEGRLEAGARALEIGAGTGKATRLFAARGLSITAIEPGATLIEVARSALDAPVTFVKARFEDWPMEPAAFDLVYAGQAFHWVDQETGYARAGEVLRPAGVLALFWNRPGREQDPVQRELAALREARAVELAVEVGPDNVLAIEAAIADAIRDTELFEAPRLARFPWIQTLSAREYAALLETYSAYAILDPRTREPLLEECAALIEARGGMIDVHYDAVVHLARRRSE